MPIPLRIGPYRLYFYSYECIEPRHTHVDRERLSAKFWLDPDVSLAENYGFSRQELRRIERMIREHTEVLTTKTVTLVRVVGVEIDDDTLSVDLEDGRTIAVPIGWYPRLAYGTPQERANWQISGAGCGVHSPDLDEDIGVEGLLLGRISSESAASFERWLQNQRYTDRK